MGGSAKEEEEVKWERVTRTHANDFAREKSVYFMDEGTRNSIYMRSHFYFELHNFETKPRGSEWVGFNI